MPPSNPTSPPSILIAQSLGLTTAAFLSGHILLLTPPASTLLQSPHPPILLSILSASAFTYLSSQYLMTLQQRKGEIYALAAFVVAGMGVWRWVDGPSVGQPVGKAERGNRKEEAEAKWRTRDTVRGVLVFVGGVVGGGWAVWM